MHSTTALDVLCRKSLRHTLAAALAAAAVVVLAASPLAASENDGFKSIFDGKTLDDWDGNPKFWKVADGAITGQTTEDNPTKGNTFIIWRGDDVGDFELKLEYRIVGGNSGIQYRSFEVPNEKWVVGGYQADFEAGKRYSGILYGERYRGILANRGQKTELVRDSDGKFEVKAVGSVGNSDEIQEKIREEDWNKYHVIAKGFHFTHLINGVKTCECIDNDEKERRASGIVALQLHAGPPMKVQFRNVRLKKLDAENDRQPQGALRIDLRRDKSVVIANEVVPLDRLLDDLKQASPKRLDVAADPDLPASFVQQVIGLGQQAGIERFALRVRGDQNDPPGDQAPAAEAVSVDRPKKIAFIAGRPSHGYGAHEHKAGCTLLARALNESGLPVKAEVYTGGWPDDAGALADADTIVIYADGGGGHPFNAHLDEIDKLMKQGVGLVCLHYAVEVPKGKSGDAFLNWTGGYFEMDWSVNPHWDAKYEKLPQHPITRGVEPFTINDEWYYHMRFRENLEGVTPILSDLPPARTLVKADGSLARPEGGHSNNPDVRQAVLEQKQPQHMAWARERADSGRGFGFTGGHVHWNWGHNEFRQLVLNAIVWTAGADVPTDGVSSRPLTVEDLMANQDYPVPDSFNPARIQRMLDEWNRPRQAAALEHASDSLEIVQANLQGNRAVLVDVREQAEWDARHLKLARLVPLSVLSSKTLTADELAERIPRDTIVYTHCRAGGRALAAGKLLKARGYDVRPLAAGYEDLVKEGFDKAE